MRSAALATLLLLGIVVGAVLAGPPASGPGPLVTAPGGQDHSAIDALFAAWDRPDSPGCALGVIEDGELTYERGYGSANLDWEIPIGTDTVFYVGSVSKQFTAAAIALLAQDGLISRGFFLRLGDSALGFRLSAPCH